MMNWIVGLTVILAFNFRVRSILGSEGNSTSGNQSYFAICLIIKNDPDIVEWIDYHKKMGCSKFMCLTIVVTRL
jgi:hypothetical protein